MLLTEYADRFVQKFNNPEEASLPIVKKYLIVALRKLYRVMLSFFQQLREKGFRYFAIISTYLQNTGLLFSVAKSVSETVT